MDAKRRRGEDEMTAISDSPRMGGAFPADAFPVKVEAIVSFVQSPADAFAAIMRDAHEAMADTDGRRLQFNEGVNYTFSYGGIKHDVTLTRED